LKTRNRKLFPAFIFLLIGLTAFFVGGSVRTYIVPFVFCAIGAWLFFSFKFLSPPAASSASSHGVDPYKLSPRLVSAKEASEATSEAALTALGTHYRKEQWESVERTVDTILDTFISLLQANLDAHTIAVMFPTNDNGYRIRRYFSKSEHVDDKAIIYPGVGVIGSFLKDGLKQLNLHEIVTNSTTLYYYKCDVGIRSLMASPIVAGATERGTIIADSTEIKHFSDKDHSFLSTIAGLLGQTVYYAYLSTEYKLEHRRIVSMSSIEKTFFQHLSIDAILDTIIEIIPFAIACDRLTISLLSPDNSTGVIDRAWGLGADKFINKSFVTTEKTLIGLVYSKNMCLFRNFMEGHYETRYFQNEPQSVELSSFLAFPIGVDRCQGTFFLESLRKDAFSESNRDLLSRLATSAGLAIERLRIFEQAKNLATHDGLTGLINHREFQLLLKDEITRAARYEDPLSLVLCDIDFFKKINDTFGHPFGDTVLKEIAAKLRENVRDGVDVVARYGGEEFSLVLVKTDAVKAQETVERIRQQIEHFIFKSPRNEDIHLTMSFGIAVYLQHAKQLDTLIQKADKALYRAKENGRNRVEIF
jgi:diguanylate cyclase (GGDEF)-like protein